MHGFLTYLLTGDFFDLRDPERLLDPDLRQRLVIELLYQPELHPLFLRETERFFTPYLRQRLVTEFLYQPDLHLLILLLTRDLLFGDFLLIVFAILLFKRFYKFK